MILRMIYTFFHFTARYDLLECECSPQFTGNSNKDLNIRGQTVGQRAQYNIPVDVVADKLKTCTWGPRVPPSYEIETVS